MPKFLQIKAKAVSRDDEDNKREERVRKGRKSRGLSGAKGAENGKPRERRERALRRPDRALCWRRPGGIRGIGKNEGNERERSQGRVTPHASSCCIPFHAILREFPACGQTPPTPVRGGSLLVSTLGGDSEGLWLLFVQHGHG